MQAYQVPDSVRFDQGQITVPEPVLFHLWLEHTVTMLYMLSSSSSSSSRGRGGRSIRSTHGPILGAVKGVSSEQTTVWTIWCSQVMGGWPRGLRQFGKGGTPSRTSQAMHRTALAGTLSGICATWLNSVGPPVNTVCNKMRSLALLICRATASCQTVSCRITWKFFSSKGRKLSGRWHSCENADGVLYTEW